MHVLQRTGFCIGSVAIVSMMAPVSAATTPAPMVLSAYGPPVSSAVPSAILGGPVSLGVSPDGSTRYFGTYGGGVYKTLVSSGATSTIRLPDFNGNIMRALEPRPDGKALYVVDQATTTRSVIIAPLNPPTKPLGHIIPSVLAIDVSVAPDVKHAAIAGGESIVVMDLATFVTRVIVLPRTVESSLSASTLAYGPQGTQLFFANGADRLERINQDGSARTTLVTGLSQPNLGAIDQMGELYVGTSDTTAALTGQLLRFHGDGTGRTVLLSGYDQISQVALDGTGSVTFFGTKYVGQSVSTTVVRLPLRSLAPLSPRVTSVASGRAMVSFARSTAAQKTFTVTSSTSPALSCTTTALSCTVTGLKRGVPVFFTVTASNGFVTSPKSLPTQTVKA